MFKLNLQLFGGRGSSSGSRGGGGGGSSIQAYKEAEAERRSLVNNKAPYDEIRAAMDKQTEAANKVASSASKSDWDAGAKKYFDDLGREEGAKAQERIINKLARINKDGSTSATATKAAEGYGDIVAQNVGDKLAGTGAFHVSNANNKRGAEALIKEAKRRKNK